MAVEVVSLGVQKLWDLLSQEYKQFQGFEDQIIELKSNLTLLKSFLKDADAKKHTSEIVRNYVEEIKEIIYDAEDTIETFILKEELGKTSGIKKRIKRFAFTVMDHKELASDIGEISKRISKVIQDMQSFGVQQMIANGSRLSSHPLQERQREMRQEFARDYESNLVGLEANVEKLVAYLVKGDDIQIVSLTGMGGVGKTTLARQVFNHEDVKDHFDGLAWVCVSQEFTRISVWQTILQNFTSKEKKDEILKMKEAELQDELFRLLETSKSLIVFDDIWKEEDWDRIKPIFPPKKDWKVLLTSRKEGVAVRGDTSYIHFKPECLTIQNSWKLFEMVAMPRRDASKFKIDEEMEEIGKQMIKHCGGLPLAIKVLGGLLATKYSSHEWKRVFEDIGSHIVGRTNFNDHNNSLIYHVLSMSFEELPNYLKKCFLYLAHFPEDYHIDIGGMALLWAAEGIIEPRHYDGEAIRNIVDSYIEELVRRNMVISKRSVTTLRFETCHLHDMMREICLFKAKEENFLHIVSIRSPTSNSQSPGTSRRLVLHYPTTLHIVRDINNSKLRSLVVVFDFLWRESWMISGSSFTRLKLVRVLDLYKAKFTGGKLPSGIGKLIHLRYLSLEETKVSHLPSSLGNLMLLIYLNINVDVEDIFVPNVLMGMQELRYLALPRHMHKKTKLELSNLVNLETLENFSTWNSSLEDLRIMERLHTLTIILTREAVMENLYASIGGLRHLENLKIVEDDGFNMRIEEGIVLDLIHLRYLTLDIQIPRLPKEQHFPSHLTTISLLRCRLEEDPMPILEKLLHLNVVDLVHESFSGRRMVCSGSGFPKLHVLAIFGLKEWEEWIVEEGSMPLLHTLRIWKCPKLKELPDGLPFIHSLKELDMDEEWKVRLSKGGEEYYKVQHIPLVKCLW